MTVRRGSCDLQLRSGRQVELIAADIHNDFNPRELSWKKPENVAGTLKNKYWRKYLRAIQKEDNEDLRKYFGRYICREWNARHTGAEQLVDLRLIHMREKTLPDYRRTAPQEVILWEQRC